MPEYRVKLDVYDGPMDLLLYLLKREEVDIYDIPIARITDSYMRYLTDLKETKDFAGLDIDVAGDFLVMAATLMEIKSAMLLPRTVPADGQASAAQELSDPRAELVRQLLEYKRFKETAQMLERRQRDHASRFARDPGRASIEGGESDEAPPLDLEEIQVWDLLSAFTRLLREVGIRKPREHEVTYDDTPIDLHAADIEDQLQRIGHLTLRQLIVGRASRSEMIGVFLALLELIRQKRILVQQTEILGEVEIIRAPKEHLQANDEPEAPAPIGGSAGSDSHVP